MKTRMTVGRRLRVAAASLLMGAVASQAGAQTASNQTAGPPVAVEVDLTRPGATINRNIFGQFAEHLGTGIYGGVWVGEDSPIPNVRGIRTDVVQALRAIKVPNVRWPGGCFADEYHWRDGVGPASERRHRLNASWGNVIEPNSFGTHEFMDFADQVGAEVFLSVNVGSGTVQEAADWLEYLTADQPTALAQERAANGHPEPYRIKYLGLGNENWGCGGAMSPEHYVEKMKQFAIYARNLDRAQTGENAMQRIAVGWDSGNEDYTEEVMKAWKDKVWSWNIEGVSLHGYTIPNSWEAKGPSVGFGEDEYAKGIRATLKMEGWITAQTAIMDRYDPEKKLALFVDEWGLWADPMPGSNPSFLQQQNTMRDAVIAALNLNIFMRHADRVRATNIAQMANVLQAMILTDGAKMVLTPTYHVYEMYVPFQDATFVPLELDEGVYRYGDIELPRADAVAAGDKDGVLWLSLVNVDATRPLSLTVRLPGEYQSASGRLLAAPAVDSHNSFERPHDVEPVAYSGRMANGQMSFELPPRSLAVVRVQ